MFLPSVERASPFSGQSVPQIAHLFAFKPEQSHYLNGFTQEVMRGESDLSPGFRELIAAYVSQLNDCDFCFRSHKEAASILLGDYALVDAVLYDYDDEPDGRQRAMFAFVEKVTYNPTLIDPEDVKAVTDAGWSESAVFDAITVAALFNFYNRWVGANGVEDMSDDDYAKAGQRIASLGYTR